MKISEIVKELGSILEEEVKKKVDLRYARENEGYRKTTKTLALRRRITTYMIFIIIGSTLSLLVAISILGFIWFGGQSNPTWKKFVDPAHFTTVVTLTTLTLRISVSLQAGIATSMFAALVLEGPGIRLADAPELSIMRVTNSGPHTFLWLYLRQPKSIRHFVLLISLVLSSFAIQFSSTLLLHDFGSTTGTASNFAKTRVGLLYPSGTLPSFRNVAEPMEFDFRSHVRSVNNFWSAAPTSFPTFGQDAPGSVTGPSSGDTGHDIPYTFDARVYCTQPALSKLHVCGTENNKALCGTVSPVNTTSGLVSNLNDVAFECPLARTAPLDSEAQPVWSLCGLNASAGGLISFLDPTNNATLAHHWDETFPPGNWVASKDNLSWPVDLGNAYLILSITDSFDLSSNFSLAPNVSFLWTDTYILDGNSTKEPSKFRTSICYDALPRDDSYYHISRFNVSMERSKSDFRTEPEPSWSSSRNTYDTAKQRGQFDNSANRPMLVLSPYEIENTLSEMKSSWSIPEDHDIHSVAYQRGTSKIWFNETSFPWMLPKILPERHTSLFATMCSPCSTHLLDGQLAVDVFQASLFEAFIDRAQTDPRYLPLALQSQLTTLLRIAYYSWMPYFDEEELTTTVFTNTIPSQVGYIGSCAVVGIITTHIASCMIIGAMFLRKSQYSLLGNAWSAFAQVAGAEEAQTILEDVYLSTDAEVASMVKERGHIKKRFKVTDTGADTGATTVAEESRKVALAQCEKSPWVIEYARPKR
ncbi:hypothetical protein BDV96DRAFT_644393 [Lophiotrema nucula]|uniref:Uncharacterized protein n=1 Tax=Lophiotrema nucula TaxID=690887 RepID=A0A6A5ZI92_9PLEO|nr:hypothetical protein BDV96DRAFT_644393 [Lophiotrema nucula]